MKNLNENMDMNMDMDMNMNTDMSRLLQENIEELMDDTFQQYQKSQQGNHAGKTFMVASLFLGIGAVMYSIFQALRSSDVIVSESKVNPPLDLPLEGDIEVKPIAEAKDENQIV